jgi:uroporphyrinogen decarboxylase
MDHRERLRIALNHQEPDRVPIDLGGGICGITIGANQSIKTFLGIESEDPVAHKPQQLAVPCNALLERLHVDTRYLYVNLSIDGQDIEIDKDHYQDEFGFVRQAVFGLDDFLLYYDFVKYPLSHIETISDLAKYQWPDSHDPIRFTGLEEAGLRLFENTN